MRTVRHFTKSHTYRGKLKMPSISFIGSGGIPTGTIAVWTGLIANIPSGWIICDGTGGTPDLRDKFVRSTDGVANPGGTGGTTTETLTIAQMPSHNHGLNGTPHTHNFDISLTASGGGQGSQLLGGGDAIFTNSLASQTELTKAVDPIQFQGGGGSHNNVPAFFEVIFIYKT